jgi:uncharacterized surface protein with fasciclin (FAS1) repeats
MQKLFVILLALGLIVMPVLGQDTTEERDPAPTAETSTSSDDMITGAGTMQSETITTTTNTSQSRMAFLSPTIVDVASNNFVYLTAAIDSAGLRDTLESGEYTLFAPNDGAFITLTNELGMSPDELLSNPRLLEVILSYHVIPGSIRVEDITTVDMPLDTTTLLGPGLSFGIDADVSRVIINGGAASIEQANLEATNGYVHVIDNVLLPPDYETLAAQPSTTMTDDSDLSEDAPLSAADFVANNFVILEAAVEAAGLQDELASGEITLFAPTDGAFTTFLTEQEMSQDELLSNPSLLTQVLEYHIIPGSVSADSLRNNMFDLQSSLDAVPSFGFDSTTSRITLDNGRASVVAPDIFVNNGIVHVIDNVLNPPNLMTAQ